MTENKQEQKTFKWGDEEYLINDLLKAHADQKHNFYEFAKVRGQYDDEALVGLRTAVDNRINAVKEGKSFSADGVLDGDVVDNISIQTKRKGLFKKAKYVDQDNTEWAKYYIDKLVENIKPYKSGDSSDNGTWDISKHGFAAYLSGQGLNAQDIFEKYDLRDANNPDAARSFAQRDSELRKHLINYKTWLEGKGFDFTKNDNEWDDNFMTTLSDLINNNNWNDKVTLAASLRKLGAGNEYTTAFTSDRWDLSKSQADLDAEAKATKEAKEAKQQSIYLDEFEDLAYNNKRKSNPIRYERYDGDFTMDWYGDLNINQQEQYGTYLGRNNEAWTKAWNTLMQNLKSGTSYSDKNAGILLQGTFLSNPQGFIDLGDGNYLIRDSVTEYGQGTVYNPSTGYIDTVFLGDLATNNSEIQNIYRQLAYNYVKNKYGVDYNKRPDVLKEGGELIPKHQYGNSVVYNWETASEANKTKASQNGITPETQAARDQYLNSDNKSVDNPNAGFANLTAGQKARIGYAIADLTSAVSAFFPGYGTAISAIAGVTSTVGNFISDLTDDAVTLGDAWKNFGMNLGMDALGLIPGGGAASKMGKIVKSLKNVVPTLVALPGVASMLANSPEIAQSWKKAFDGDPEDGGSKMNYQDYMNILQVLNVAAGTTTIGRNVYKSAKKSTKQENKLAVDVVDKNNQRKAIILEGDDISNFKEANAKGEAQKFINDLEGEGNYTINEITTPNRGKFWGKDQNDKFHIFNQNPFGKTNTGKANVLELRIDNTTGKLYADTGRWSGDLLDDNLVNGKELRWKQEQRTDINNTFEQLRQKAKIYKTNTDRFSKIRDDINAKIQAQNQAITNKQSEITSKQQAVDNFTDTANTIQNWINSGGLEASKKSIRNAKNRIKRLEKKKTGKSLEEQSKIDVEIAELKTEIAKTNAEIAANSPEAVLAAQENASKATSEQSALQVEMAKLQALLDKLKNTKTKLDTRIQTHSDAYNSINNTNQVRRVFNNSEYTFDIPNELKNLDGLYKKGGSINRHKINKFLNYGKR